MENAVRDSIEFTPIMKKAMKPMDSWHVTRREDRTIAGSELFGEHLLHECEGDEELRMCHE